MLRLTVVGEDEEASRMATATSSPKRCTRMSAMRRREVRTASFCSALTCTRSSSRAAAGASLCSWSVMFRKFAATASLTISSSMDPKSRPEPTLMRLSPATCRISSFTKSSRAGHKGIIL